MKSRHLYAVVLAAGTASRFGAPKQLASFDGETLVMRAVRLAESVCSERSILVAGSNWQRVHDACAPLAGFLVHNESFTQGMGSSIACGIRAIPECADAVLLLLADQPLISSLYLEEMIDAWGGSDSTIVCSEFSKSIGPPVLFPARYFTELSQLDGDPGARKLLEKFTKQVINLTCPAASADIDTPADLENLRRHP